MKLYLISAILLIMTINLSAQNIQQMRSYRDSINKYAHIVVNNFHEETQQNANDELISFIKRAINQEKSINYTFDSIPNVSFLKSKDKKVRVVTWTIPLRDGSYQFHGLAQTYNKRYKKFVITQFEDKSAIISNPMDKRLTAKKWFGAHYYNLIQKKFRGGTTTYTLLGWKGVDQLTKQKVIEVLTVKSNGDVVFGYPMFIVKGFDHFKSRRPRRIIFTYSARANMHMTYETHRIKIITKKKSKNRKQNTRGFGAQQAISDEKVKVKESIEKMIVFDRLVPPSENLEGIYSYYIPATNVFDGFIFKNNKWVYFPDVDARNSSPEKPKKQIKYELFEEEQEDSIWFFRRNK